MIANALLFTIVILLGLRIWLLDQLKFMARYKAVLLPRLRTTILIFLAVLFVNYLVRRAIGRRFFLKNTGRKLSHLDKQFNVTHPDMPIPESEEDSTNVARRLFLRSARRRRDARHVHAPLQPSAEITTS